MRKNIEKVLIAFDNRKPTNGDSRKRVLRMEKAFGHIECFLPREIKMVLFGWRKKNFHQARQQRVILERFNGLQNITIGYWLFHKMNKTLPQYLILEENHSTTIKVRKIFDLANKLGITFEHNNNHCVMVSDKDRDLKLPDLYLNDAEGNDFNDSFPPTFDYYLTYQNPEYLEHQRKEREAYYTKKEEEARLEKERRLAKEKLEAEKRAKEKEASERKLLAELKAKYES